MIVESVGGSEPRLTAAIASNLAGTAIGLHLMLVFIAVRGRVVVLLVARIVRRGQQRLDVATVDLVAEGLKLLYEHLGATL